MPFTTSESDSNIAFTNRSSEPNSYILFSPPACRSNSEAHHALRVISPHPRYKFFFFCLFIARMRPMEMMARIYSPFPVRCPRSGGSLQAPLCPPPRPVPRRSAASHQGDHKGNAKLRKSREYDKGKDAGKEPHLRRPCGRHVVGCGQEQRRSPQRQAPRPPLPTPPSTPAPPSPTPRSPRPLLPPPVPSFPHP